MSDSPADSLSTAHAGAPISGPLDDRRSPGEALGRYVMLEEVGCGGMGRVLRAYDPKLQREVALKEVRRLEPGSDGTARLVSEARAMARLSHPNVVAVYDVEVLQGIRGTEVLLVMEYVAGMTLRAWLRERTKPWREVVGRFVDAGRGLAAAHQAGLLHLDFKPANVLVREDTVKVTDFGLAKGKNTDSSGLDSSSRESDVGLTAAGVVVGTPRYMPPEQHGGQGLTEAADQYALCVSLWEALCERPPFVCTDIGPLEDEKLRGPPPWPRAGIPNRIVRAIERGLASDPSDRWPSIDALLHQLTVDRHKRRRAWALSLGGVAIAGIAGSGVQIWGAEMPEPCSGAAEQMEGVWDDALRSSVASAIAATESPNSTFAWERTRTELDGYAADWISAHTEACRATTVRGEQSSEVMDRRIGCLWRAKTELGAVTRILSDADEGVVRRVHKLVGSLRPLSRCEDVEALLSEVEPPPPDVAPAVETVRQSLAEARAQRTAGRYPEARKALERAKGSADGVDYPPMLTEIDLAQGDVLDALGDFEGAEAALERALEWGAHRRQWNEVLDAAGLLIYVVGYERRQVERALGYRAVARGLAKGDARREATVANSVAAVYWSQAEYGEAEAEYRRALELWEAEYGPDHHEVGAAHNNIGGTLHMRRMYPEAKTAYDRAIAIWDKTLGPEHPAIATCRSNLSHVLKALGDYEGAEREGRRALAAREKALGPEHPDVLGSLTNLGLVLGAQDKLDEAERAHRRAVALGDKVLGPEHPNTISARVNYALFLHAQDRLVESEQEYRRALSAMEASLPADDPRVASTRGSLAQLVLDQGRATEAAELAEQAWASDRRDEFAAGTRAELAFVLARALWESSPEQPLRQRARTLARQALRGYEELTEHAQDTQDVRSWLQHHGGIEHWHESSSAR